MHIITTLVENPVPIIFIGIVAEAVLGVVLLQTGRGVLLLAMLGVLLLVLGGVALEWLVVTEVERVEASLDGVAAALEANDSNAVVSYISPAASGTRSRAQWALSEYEVTDTTIRNLEISVNRLTSPPTAEARFDGVISLAARKGAMLPYNNYPAQFTVKFRLEGDRWLITGHSEGDRRRDPRE